MMKASIYNKDTILNRAGDFVGYNLGFDYVTEHENGISGLREAFGIMQVVPNVLKRIAHRLLKATPGFGMKARTSKRIPKIFFKDGEFCTIAFTNQFVNMDAYVMDNENKVAWPGRKEDFFAKWDDQGFIITTKNRSHYDEYKKAFEDNDIAFYLGSKGFLSSGGLHVVIASRVDTEVDELMTKLDMDSYELGKKADAIGIETQLINAKKNFTALVPGWTDEEKKDVHFWLNPHDRTKHVAGWYTVDELKQWINEEGPVMKEHAAKNKTLKL